MSTSRDLTEAQFLRKLKELGMSPPGYLGYVRLACGLQVSILNCPTDRRRDQLAYLLREQDKWLAKHA